MHEKNLIDFPVLRPERVGLEERTPQLFVRSAVNYDMDLVSQETGLDCPEKTLTVQSMKDEADINVILERFGVTGELPQNIRAPLEADFVEVFDFQSAQNAIREATESFMALPAKVRLRFNNDPGAFVEFCSDAENLDEMRKLGLAVPEEPKEPEATQAPTGNGNNTQAPASAVAPAASGSSPSP